MVSPLNIHEIIIFVITSEWYLHVFVPMQDMLMFVDLLIIICGYAEWILGGPVDKGGPVDLGHGGVPAVDLE